MVLNQIFEGFFTGFLKKTTLRYQLILIVTDQSDSNDNNGISCWQCRWYQLIKCFALQYQTSSLNKWEYYRISLIRFLWNVLKCFQRWVVSIGNYFQIHRMIQSSVEFLTTLGHRIIVQDLLIVQRGIAARINNRTV